MKCQNQSSEGHTLRVLHFRCILLSLKIENYIFHT